MEKGMKTPVLVAAAIATAAALHSPANAGKAPPPPFNAERCFGISNPGMNDCQTATHSCAGEAKKAGAPDSWMYVAAGTCVKIYHGSLAPKE
jgi:uncharacterized membrane protein